MFSDAARLDPAMLGQYNYERIANDFYPTPVEFVRALASIFSLYGNDWWEPCAGQGHIALAVEEIPGAKTVTCSDLVRYDDHPLRPGFRDRVFIQDFLASTEPVLVASDDRSQKRVNGIISNPPYLTVNLVDPPEEGEDDWRHLAPLAAKYGLRGKKVSLAELFLRHALALMEQVEGRVAFFLRNEFDCGKGRLDLFRDHPAYVGKVVCTKRPRWIEGSTGSPRHNYAWFVFDWRNGCRSEVHYTDPDSAIPLTLTIHQ